MDEIELFLYIESVDWDFLEAALELHQLGKDEAARVLVLTALEFGELDEEPDEIEIEIKSCSETCKNTKCCKN